MEARLDDGWGPAVDTTSDNPFVRYRRSLSSYHLWRRAGGVDSAYIEMVAGLDQRVARAAGHGFTRTPVAPFPTLDKEIGARVWVKDETANVAGSHKGRHLFGVLVLLEVLEALGRQPGRRLAIASCGNAALAAGVLAGATGRSLTAFVPEGADAERVRALTGMGVVVTRCPREGQAGDPCLRRLREAVAAGAVPFSCQGPENGAVIEGGSTLAWEVAEQMGGLDRVVVQVGGGALASSVARVMAGAAPRAVLDTVQTTGAHPFERAVAALRDLVAAGVPLAETMAMAARTRSRFMWPWEATPASVAGAIVDDETYDWRAVADAVLATGGTALVADEALLLEANQLARRATGIDVDVTGSAGLAGLLLLARTGQLRGHERILVLFTGGAGGWRCQNAPS